MVLQSYSLIPSFVCHLVTRTRIVHISSLVFRPILTEFGTDNLPGPESDLAKAEFENLNWLPWKS